MIYASATVDEIGPNLFRVEVTGRAPHDFVKVYEMFAKDERAAAFEGIERFGRDFAHLETSHELQPSFRPH